MIKCEVIEYFTLKKFNELENIVRANENNNTKDGELFVGDTFDCTEEMAKYLTGDNENKIVVVKIANEYEIKEDKENEQIFQEEDKQVEEKEDKKKKSSKK